MDFWGFLNWLYGVFTSVIRWFGYRFEEFYSTVTHTWDWIVARGQVIYDAAVAWALQRISDVKVTLRNLIDDAKSTAWTYYVAVRAYAYELYNAGKTFADDVKHYLLSQLAIEITSRVAATALTENTLKGFVTTGIASAKTDILNAVAPVLPIAAIAGILSVLANRAISSKLLQVTGPLYNGVVTLVNDPVGFIFGAIWDQFLIFLSFALGYGLGTIEASLPTRPDWKGNVIGSGPGTVLPPISGTGELVRPVSPLYVSGYSFTSTHHGTDFGLTMGQPVYAAHDGIVTYAGPDNVGYGIRVDISGSKYWSRYGHAQKVVVAVNQQVKRGQHIMYGDSTGNSTGPHLHFELKINGAYVDPVLYL
jgi:hypothetical protein